MGPVLLEELELELGGGSWVGSEELSLEGLELSWLDVLVDDWLELLAGGWLELLAVDWLELLAVGWLDVLEVLVVLELEEFG